MCEQHLTEEERLSRPRDAVGLVDEIVVAMTNSRIYSAGHPRLMASIDTLAESFRVLQGTLGGKRLELGNSEGFLFFDRRPLLGATLSARRLTETLNALGSGGLAFDPGTGREGLQTLIQYMSTGCRGAEDYTEANLALTRMGCSTIHFLPPYTADARDDLAASLADLLDDETHDITIELDSAHRLYQGVVDVMQTTMVKCCQGETIDLSGAQGYIESVLTRLATDTKSMMSLARYETYDAFTFGHSIRVCFIALNFARHLTADPVILERIGLAALLHDIGKAWVPFEILHSTGKLSPEERQEMSRHAVYGGQILLDSPDPDPLSVAVAFSHHQTLDGGGYPTSVRSARQSTATMIAKLSDVFEALTAVRPYKPRMSPARAYRIMMSMEGHFEPSLLRRFVHVNGVYPTGSRVVLTDGSTARVHAQTDCLTKPIVITETASSGEVLFEEDVMRIDLSADHGARPLEVKEILLDAEM